MLISSYLYCVQGGFSSYVASDADVLRSNVTSQNRDGGGGAGRAAAPPLFCAPAPTFCKSNTMILFLFFDFQYEKIIFNCQPSHFSPCSAVPAKARLGARRLPAMLLFQIDTWNDQPWTMLSLLQVDINNIMHTITICISGIICSIMQERVSNWDSVNHQLHES